MALNITLFENGQQVGPVLLEVIPQVEEVHNLVELFEKAINLVAESLRRWIARDRIDFQRAFCEVRQVTAQVLQDEAISVFDGRQLGRI